MCLIHSSIEGVEVSMDTTKKIDSQIGLFTWLPQQPFAKLRVHLKSENFH